MDLADVARRALDPRDAHESLLDVRGDIFVYCTAP